VNPGDLVYDPYDYAIDTDPHPTFKRLRDEAPIYWNEQHGFWALSRFHDVLAASIDHETFSSARGTVIELMDHPMANPPMIFMDPPQHTRFRKLVRRGASASCAPVSSTASWAPAASITWPISAPGCR
jgi:cytochrome P450